MAEMILNKEQEKALELIKNWAAGKGDGLITLSGYGGTGKTTLLKVAKQFINDVYYTSMTGRAALRLSDAAGVKATTLHKVLFKQAEQLKNGEIYFKTLNSPIHKYLCIDESSMISMKIYDDLLQWVKFYKTRILFIGDSFQLPPVMTEKEKDDNPDFSVFNFIKGTQLTQIMRSGDGIIDVVSAIRKERKIITTNNDAYEFIEDSEPMERAIKDYLDDPIDHILITWTNKLRMTGNRRVRELLGYDHYLPYVGEPIIFRKNGQSVLNGEMGIVKKIIPDISIQGNETHRVLLDDGRSILCFLGGKDEYMDGNAPFIKNWKGYLADKKKHKINDPIPATYGYVATTHSCQGNEFRRATLVLKKQDIQNPNFRLLSQLPNGESVPFGIRLIYTALSRAKEKASFIVG